MNSEYGPHYAWPNSFSDGPLKSTLLDDSGLTDFLHCHFKGQELQARTALHMQLAFFLPSKELKL